MSGQIISAAVLNPPTGYTRTSSRSLIDGALSVRRCQPKNIGQYKIIAKKHGFIIVSLVI
jgi:hypothetical protein